MPLLMPTDVSVPAGVTLTRRSKNRAYRHGKKSRKRRVSKHGNHDQRTPDEIGKYRRRRAENGLHFFDVIAKWDFDENQPRDYRGRWSDTGFGNAKAIGHRASSGFFAEQHTGRSSSGGGQGNKSLGVASAFDHAAKTITVKPPRPNRGAKPTYDGFVPDNKLIPRDRALYERNNGPKAITNARLKELFLDPSKITPQEKVLIASSRSAKSIDGNSVIRGIPTSRGKRDLERYDLIGQLASKFAPGSGNRSTKREGISEERRQKINEKRAISGKVSSTQFGQISDRIGKSWSTDGKTAICVFCGKPVRLAGMSIETPKPKAKGGGYSDPGNTWPAHKSCNTRAGAQAQKDPQTYYEDMMLKFKQRVPPEVKAKLPEVYKSHSKYLGTYAAAKKKGFK